MSLVDLIVGIVVVTILVTVVVGVATYVAYKFRLARQPPAGEEDEGPRYFEVHHPPGADDAEAEDGAPAPGDTGSGGARTDRDAAEA